MMTDLDGYDKILEDKLCRKCWIDKPISQYFKDKSRPGGYGAVCKKCQLNVIMKYRKIISPEKYKKYASQWMVKYNKKKRKILREAKNGTESKDM